MGSRRDLVYERMNGYICKNKKKEKNSSLWESFMRGKSNSRSPGEVTESIYSRQKQETYEVIHSFKRKYIRKTHEVRSLNISEKDLRSGISDQEAALLSEQLREEKRARGRGEEQGNNQSLIFSMPKINKVRDLVNSSGVGVFKERCDDMWVTKTITEICKEPKAFINYKRGRGNILNRSTLGHSEKILKEIMAMNSSRNKSEGLSGEGNMEYENNENNESNENTQRFSSGQKRTSSLVFPPSPRGRTNKEPETSTSSPLSLGMLLNKDTPNQNLPSSRILNLESGDQTNIHNNNIPSRKQKGNENKYTSLDITSGEEPFIKVSPPKPVHTIPRIGHRARRGPTNYRELFKKTQTPPRCILHSRNNIERRGKTSSTQNSFTLSPPKLNVQQTHIFIAPTTKIQPYSYRGKHWKLDNANRILTISDNLLKLPDTTKTIDATLALEHFKQRQFQKTYKLIKELESEKSNDLELLYNYKKLIYTEFQKEMKQISDEYKQLSSDPNRMAAKLERKKMNKKYSKPPTLAKI